MSEERNHVENGDLGGSGDARPRGPDPPELQLPPSLKPFEAALSSLVPRSDRLDRDLIMFRAGQLSVAGRGRRAAWARSALWPAALAAMTTAAAVLLVTLLARPEPPAVERVRIVEAQVASPQRDDAGPAAVDVGHPPGDVEGAPSPPEQSRDDADVRLAIHRPVGQPFDRLSRPRQDGFRVGRMDLEVVDRMLRQGADPWTQVGLPVEGIEQAEAPMPYLERLRTMLDDQARALPAGDRPSSSLESGADS